MAHIVCSAKKVREAAQAIIDSINEYRSKMDEKAIVHTMQHKRVCWWKVWQPVGMTREQAIKRLDDVNGIWGWRCHTGYGDMSKARRLLLLAEHGDPVTVDEESASILWG